MKLTPLINSSEGLERSGPSISLIGMERKIPLYKQIHSAIKQRIQSGELKAGDPIDSERVVAKHYGVSLMTARHALKELELEGLVLRRPAVGTLVAPPRIQFNKLISFSEQMASRGLAVHSKILALVVTKKEDEVSSRLSLPCGSTLIKLERLRFGDNDPFAIEVTYFAQKDLSKNRAETLNRRSLFGLFENELQRKLAYADEEVDATAADPRTAKFLKIPQGAPILRIRQILYTAGPQPIAFSRGLYRSDRHSFVIRRFR